MCWTCQRPGSRSCSWDDDFTPVEGWKATPTKVMVGAKKDGATDSYIVHECPMFLAMDLTGRGVKPKQSEMADICALGMMFAMGWNDSQIARETGISRRTVARKRVLWLRCAHGTEGRVEEDDDDE